MAPNTNNASNLVYASLKIGEVDVRTLVNSWAEASCCSEGWYKANRHLFGGLEQGETQVVGVGNIPIRVAGRTMKLPLQWEEARTRVSLLVVPTLVAHDVILGMDVMSVLGVHIDTTQRRARPTILPTSVSRPNQKDTRKDVGDDNHKKPVS